MELVSDGLLIAAASVAALYCYILSRKLSALSNVDNGLGSAINGLSERIESTRESLSETKSTTTSLARDLAIITARADAASERLETLLDRFKSANSRNYVTGDEMLSYIDKSTDTSENNMDLQGGSKENDILAELKRIAASAE
jgi:hypothetical protein